MKTQIYEKKKVFPHTMIKQRLHHPSLTSFLSLSFFLLFFSFCSPHPTHLHYFDQASFNKMTFPIIMHHEHGLPTDIQRAWQTDHYPYHHFHPPPPFLPPPTPKQNWITPDTLVKLLQSCLTPEVLLVPVYPQVSIKRFGRQTVIVHVLDGVTVTLRRQKDGGVVVGDAEPRIARLRLTDVNLLKDAGKSFAQKGAVVLCQEVVVTFP